MLMLKLKLMLMPKLIPTLLPYLHPSKTIPFYDDDRLRQSDTKPIHGDDGSVAQIWHRKPINGSSQFSDTQKRLRVCERNGGEGKPKAAKTNITRNRRKKTINGAKREKGLAAGNLHRIYAHLGWNIYRMDALKSHSLVRSRVCLQNSCKTDKTKSQIEDKPKAK